MPFCPLSPFGHGSFDALRFLLQVISGVCEGSFFGLPWQDLPCIRSVVKERVAIAAFSPCSCISLSASTPATQNSGFRIDNRAASLVIGCKCTGWRQGTVGTLACSDSGLRLYKEILALRVCVINSVAPLGSIPSLQRQFARISLWSAVSEMAQHGGNSDMMDIKKNLRRLYELLSMNVMDNRATTQVIKQMEDTVSYTSNQVSNHDARIDDNESRLLEIQGQVERIAEDLQKFISMNQSSRVHVASGDNVLPMEEESVLQPRGNP